MMTSVRRLLISLPLLLMPLAWGCRRSPALQANQKQEQSVLEQVEPVQPVEIAVPVLPTRPDLPRAPSGAHYPLVPLNPDQLALLL